MSSFRRHPFIQFISVALVVFVFVFGVSKSTGQAKVSQIHGVVQDSLGQAIAKATVTIQETGTQTLTDDGGGFTIAAPHGTVVHLTLAAVGFFPQTLTVSAEQLPELEIELTRTVLVREQVSVTAPRLEIPLAVNPAAMSIVAAETLNIMPREIGAEEALAPVPGVKVDNQANQDRVHVSIRGQGILSEHGLRGIEVLLDGIPLNDPSGFVPDLFDVDWASVQEVTVVRGPVAFLYGGGSSGGVIDVTTRTSSELPHAMFSGLGGSNDYYKNHAEFSRKIGRMSAYASSGRAAGSGYRVHTRFYGDNLYGKLGFDISPRFQLNFIAFGTGYFNQNPEGLNLAQVQQDPRQPNPDSVTFNEYMKTKRGTGGLNGQWKLTDHQHLSFTAFGRYTSYQEAVPSSVDHQTMGSPGGSVQYDADLNTAKVLHHFSVGVDLDGQTTDDYRHPNLGGGRENSVMLASQHISEKRVGGFATERLGLGPKWSLLASVRGDRLSNSVTDHLKLNGLDLSGERAFDRVTGRAGVTFNPSAGVALYASWGQGFTPPATEELYANPDALGGFNVRLKPATSWGVEGGVRGTVKNSVYYQASVFRLDTTNDFERYRIASRPLETFYGNAGKTSRYGLESEVRWTPTRRVTFTGAYTYSHFKYTEYDSQVYPGNLTGNRIPNSPNHQLYAGTTLELTRGLFASINTQAFSRAYIDPTNAASISGYDLLNAHVSQQVRCGKLKCELYMSGRNLGATNYIAFTEPDPDGNSYQPGARREVFGGIRIRF